MLAKTISCGLDGVIGYPVEVEAFISSGMVSFEIVGLPSAAVRESRDRIRAAIVLSGQQFPLGRVTVNLAPADVKKEGTAFELAIAVALLAAKQPGLYRGLEDTMLLGELSLQGKLMPVRGALGMAITAAEQGVKRLILPKQNEHECECLDGVQIFPAETLTQVCEHLSGKTPIAPLNRVEYDGLLQKQELSNDIKRVKGQPMARKALEIAAAGGHNLLMIGIPGSGKTMLARCLPGILPPLTYEESLETTLIHSSAGELPENAGLMTTRPFRAPHHNISMPAMIGGGTRAKPGEVSLAHNGVLFLDELPEFQRPTLEALRQPLEDGFINVSRVNGQNRYPSHCMLVAGMNPCPCGNYGSKRRACHCSPNDIKRYLSRISGPLLDRIDIQVETDAVTIDEVESAGEQEDSLTVRARVLGARQAQQKRYTGLGYYCNAQLDKAGVERFCALKPEVKTLLHQAMERFNFSLRTYDRMIKVARTIADLAAHEQIEAQDLAQAIQFRNMDGKYWK